MTLVRLSSGTSDHLRAAAHANRVTAETRGYGVAHGPRGRNRHVIICGSGPSLATPESLGTLRQHRGPIWACNWSLRYLWEQGIHPTHGVAIDGTVGMLRDWPERYPVTYYLASTVHPDLVAHLDGSPIEFFHTWHGEGLMAEYLRWPLDMFCVGYGLTVVTRAICLAVGMLYRRITVLGGDCALGPRDAIHPDGATIAEAYGHEQTILQGRVRGRTWRATPDLLFDATAQQQIARMYPKVKLGGDTLPRAFRDFTVAQLGRVISLTDGLITTSWKTSTSWLDGVVAYG